VNDKNFDVGQLRPQETLLRDFYKRLLNFTIGSDALMGAYQEIHFYNKEQTENYDHRVLSYARWSTNEKLVVVSNFDKDKRYSFDLKIPQEIIQEWKLEDGIYLAVDGLYGSEKQLLVKNGVGHISIALHPLESFIFELK
jgi:1,4-alpha-glucan branching enzyme